MRLFKTIVLIGVVLALDSCFKEDYSVCIGETGVELGFILIDDDGKDIFRENISAVNVFLFDEYGYYVMQTRVEKSELDVFQGARLSLDPGSYKVVCWGNVNGNTSVNRQDDQELYVTYSQIDPDGVTTIDADKVFYGPVSATESSRGADTYNSFEFEVTESGTAEVIHFGYAHRTLDINVKGFTDSNGQNTLPVLRVSGLPMGLGYGREAVKDGQGNTLTVVTEKTTEWVERSGVNYAWTNINALYFDIDSGVEIDIIDPVSGSSVYNGSLTRILAELNLMDETIISIPLVIEFVNGDVSIDFPAWNVEKPGTGFGR